MSDDTKQLQCSRCHAKIGKVGEKCSACGAYSSPFSDQPEMWILPPDKWLGKHAEIYSRVMTTADQSKGNILVQFSAAMALLEDWNIPGMNGNPEKWDLGKVDLSTIAWINYLVIANSFEKCFAVPLNFYKPSPTGPVV